jgi:hypothetical protein
MVNANKIEKFFSNSGTRNEVRERVITEFLKEAPGTGNGENQSKYLYFVETLKDGNRIYLERPANLHNGFDFLINVENINFSTTNRIKYNPSHDNIFNDLKIKKAESPEKYENLYKLCKILQCTPNDILIKRKSSSRK